MMTSTVVYKGGLRTACTHSKSGNEIVTDAPTDNQGLGNAFSPTDLVATATTSCMFTIMGIKARDLGIDIEGSKAEVTKIMASQPRRISAVQIDITVVSPEELDEATRLKLERAANTCPVHKSLHPDIEVETKFNYSLSK